MIPNFFWSKQFENSLCMWQKINEKLPRPQWEIYIHFEIYMNININIYGYMVL